VTPQRRGLIGLFFAQAVSLTGTRLSMIALPWFVLVSTGSVTRTGLVAACEMAPYVLGKALGGPLVDRLGPRRMSIATDLVSALAVGAVPLLHAAGALHFGALLALVGLTGAVRGPGDTAKLVLVPAVAEAAGMPLARATGVRGTVDRLADTVGPALAGLVVAALGPLGALALDAGSFAVAAATIAVTVPRHRVTEPEPGPERYFAGLRAGLAFLRGEPMLRSIVAMLAVANLVDAALTGLLLQVWARQSGHGPAAIGALIAAFGITALLGSAAAAAIGHRMPRRATYLIGFVVAGAPRFAVLALGAPLWMVVAVWALSGLGGGVVNPIVQAVIIERTPRAMLGRASAVTGSIAWAGIPLGGPFGAVLLALTGLSPALLLCAAVYLVATTLPGLGARWHGMEAPAVPGDRAEGERVPLTRHGG
jgi:MFS family permease